MIEGTAKKSPRRMYVILLLFYKFSFKNGFQSKEQNHKRRRSRVSNHKRKRGGKRL
jgi:hypothetical protein